MKEMWLLLTNICEQEDCELYKKKNKLWLSSELRVHAGKYLLIKNRWYNM